MQSYQYSSGFSIVPPRTFSDVANPQSWSIWALSGAQLASCGAETYPALSTLGLPCQTPFVKDATLALINPQLKPFQVSVMTSLNFGTVSPLTDSVDAYQTAVTAGHDAMGEYYYAVQLIEDVTIWAPFYFQGKEW